MPYYPLPDGAPLYTAAQTRALDRYAIDRCGIPGFELMQRAGRAAFRVLRRRWPAARRLAVLCGGGNNGGDGLVVAALAREQQLEVEVRVVGGEATLEKLQGEAREALAWARERGVVCRPFEAGEAIDAELVVDALLGTGLSGEVRADYRAAIEAVNASGAPVLAIDIPSGLCGDSGRVLGAAVRAEATISFIGCKRGTLTHQAGDYCGERLFDDLQVPAVAYGAVPTALRLAGRGDLARCLGRRSRNAHKGDFGHVLVVGGDYGMAGAVVMAARACARSGAGLVSVATHPEHLALVNSQCPEVMAHGVRSGQELESLVARASVVLIGPGLGQSAWSGQLLHVVQRLEVPLVLDADALNLMTRGQLVEPRHRADWILTPHPGEAARLLQSDTAAIQADRFAAVKALQVTFGGVAVLKGAGTLIQDNDGARLCPYGNPGMASGGMGDVLGGVIAGLRAQGLAPIDAAGCAVTAHALAADAQAQRQGERGLLATDLIDDIRRLLNPELVTQEAMR